VSFQACRFKPVASRLSFQAAVYQRLSLHGSGVTTCVDDG
jgi:hypothetical protein